ncbi:MAG TPA: signal peptidase I [Blastocatellia bacterium]|nr:signal peptidase I [Blastocatellia bacterium]
MSDELDLRTGEPATETEVADAERARERELPAPEIKTVDVEKKDAHEPAFKKSLPREYFESIVVTLIMALFGMTFIVQAVKVPTGSMKNTIWIQDHLLVNKFIFGPHEGLNLPLIPTREIKRGDIVVFKFPRDPQTNFVKRVIGLPGETIEYKSGKVYINGQVLPEHEVFVKPQSSEDPAPLEEDEDAGARSGAQWTVYYYKDRHDSVAIEYNDDSAKYGVRQPYKVPMKGDPVTDEIKNNPDLERIYDADGDGLYDNNQYFCMGDNRDNSLDSRYWGTVPRGSIVGRAMFVYWSIDISPEADGNFFTRSRWWRTGKFIK